MQQKILNIIYLTGFLYLVDSVELPPYFKKCSKSDPNLNECVLKNLQENWLTFIEGDNYYHIQKMNPIAINHMLVKVDDNLHGNLTNGFISFMNTFKFKSANINLDKQHWEFGYTFDKILFNGTYRVKGKLFGLPITGSGRANVTFYGGDYNYKLDYKFKEKAGKHYIEIYKTLIDYENIKLINFQIHFFKSSIGEMLSDALNENWQELGKEVSDSVSIAFGTLIQTIVNEFFSRVSFDDFFLP